MIAIVFVLFSSCCTLLAAVGVIFFGFSVASIVKMYFLYLSLSAILAVAISGTIFLIGLHQKWADSLLPITKNNAPGARLPTTACPRS